MLQVCGVGLQYVFDGITDATLVNPHHGRLEQDLRNSVSMQQVEYIQLVGESAVNVQVSLDCIYQVGI